MTDKIKVERDGGVEVIILNRPEAFNAFDLELVRGLSDVLVATAKDKDVRAVVITGEERRFVPVATSNLSSILRTASALPFIPLPLTFTGSSSR